MFLRWWKNLFVELSDERSVYEIDLHTRALAVSSGAWVSTVTVSLHEFVALLKADKIEFKPGSYLFHPAPVATMNGVIIEVGL